MSINHNNYDINTDYDYGKDVSNSANNIDEISNSPNSLPAANNVIPKKPRIRRKHHCYYCNTNITNYARHLERNHADELQVQEILSLDKTSIKRRKLIDKLRKEGDFSTSEVVPVMKIEGNSNNHIVCKFCRGYYSKRGLRRHAKKCFFNLNPSARFNAQTEGQTLMAGPFGPNDTLRVSGILNMLRADDISMTAKKDEIICEVARRYIKSHKEKHLLLVAKRYMRRLSRLLISVRSIEGNPSLRIIDILTPQKFKNLVKATRTIAEYNDTTQSYKSPSLALQMGTLLKNAINTAYSWEIQRTSCSKEKLEALKSLTSLIENDWAHEVSSQAGQNLAINKFNKPSLIPVAEDIKVMSNVFKNIVKIVRCRILVPTPFFKFCKSRRTMENY